MLKLTRPHRKGNEWVDDGHFPFLNGGSAGADGLPLSARVLLPVDGRLVRTGRPLAVMVLVLTRRLVVAVCRGQDGSQ